MKTAEIIIKNYILRDRNFTIVQNEDGWYLAIEKKYIDPDGRINTELNGRQMNASKDLSNCLRMVENDVEIEYLEGLGHSKAEAFAIRFNLTDKMDMVEKMFEGIA